MNGQQDWYVIKRKGLIWKKERKKERKNERKKSVKKWKISEKKKKRER